jgi:hypothetical protein
MDYQLREAGLKFRALAGCCPTFCNQAARGASYCACEAPISNRDMFQATFRRSSGYAKTFRCGSARCSGAFYLTRGLGCLSSNLRTFEETRTPLPMYVVVAYPLA